MIDPFTFLLKLLGYEKKEPSALLQHMTSFTHNSWLQDLQDSNRIKNYEVKLWTE
jgi:hypothetical protein